MHDRGRVVFVIVIVVVVVVVVVSAAAAVCITCYVMRYAERRLVVCDRS